MPSLSCEVKLAADKADRNTPRVVFIDLSGERDSGKWAVTQQTDDARLKLPVTAGEWGIAQDAGVNVAFLFDADLRIHLELSGVPRNLMGRVTCGFSWSGDGTRSGPPPSAIVYRVDFLCI